MAQPARGPTEAEGPCPTPLSGPVHPVDEKPAPSRLVPAAPQHLAALYAGVVTPPRTTGQAVGVVSLTRVRSRYVVAVAGGALLVLGFFPVLGAIVPLVPRPVLGAAGVVLFGSIAVSGIRTLSEAGPDDSSHIVLVAVALGAGVVPLAAPGLYAGLPAWAAQTVLGAGITAGALVAVLLDLFFHHLGTHGRTAVALKSS